MVFQINHPLASRNMSVDEEKLREEWNYSLQNHRLDIHRLDIHRLDIHRLLISSHWKVVPARWKVFCWLLTSNGHLLYYNTHSGAKFYNALSFNIKHKIYKFSLFLKVLYFVSKVSLNIPKYRRQFISRVLQLHKK